MNRTNKPSLKITGRLFDDDDTLDRYGLDLSGYRVRPKLVAIPEDEESIINIVDHAKRTSMPITPRGAGSNLSGSALGEGVIVLMNKFTELEETQEGTVSIQPGLVYDRLNSKVEKHGSFLPYSPSSGGFSTVGGNLGTRARGIRSIKYGDIDRYVRAVRFIDVEHGVVDTSERLPEDLEKEISVMRDRLRGDREIVRILADRKGLRSSSGYNIAAFFEHDNPAAIVAHLMVGSIGTLGIFTRIDLGLVPFPQRRSLHIIYYSDVIEAIRSAENISGLGPSALELLDRFGLDALRSEVPLEIPKGSKAMLLVEFDDALEEKIAKVEELLHLSNMPFTSETDNGRQRSIWRVRETMLLRVKRKLESQDQMLLPFSEDLGVPVDRLPAFVEELMEALASRNVPFTIYGHVGVGDIHIRPLIGKEEWRTVLRELSDLGFRTALKFGGTIAGEHGGGRNRSKYLKEEWGDTAYGYFREIKGLFDPLDILNPGVMFTEADITQNLVLKNTG